MFGLYIQMFYQNTETKIFSWYIVNFTLIPEAIGL